MFGALLLSLVLCGGHMGLVHSDTFDSGASLASQAIYDFIHDCEVTADAGLGGTYCVKTIGTPAAGGNFQVGEHIEGYTSGETSHTGTIPLTPSGSLFKIASCFDHSQTPWSTVAEYDGPFGLGIQVGRSTPHSGAYNSIFTLNHGGFDATQASLQLFDNSGGGSDFIAEVFIPAATNTALAVEVQMSTITGGDDQGGGSAASDGYIRVYVDGVLVIDHSGAQVGHYIDNQGPPAFWNSWANVSDPFTYVQFGVMGRVKNISIRDDAAASGFTCTAAATGTINVVKATVPAASTQSFDFTAGGGLSPATFDLTDGTTQTFTAVAVGDGYSVTETPVGGWSTSFTVSNGSSPDNISVAASETVTVTVTNTQMPLDEPTPPPCCSNNEHGYNGSGPTGPTGSTPPPTPPLTTPRIVPEGGEAPSYTSCSAGGGRPATASNPTDAQNMASAKTPLVHMKWTLPDASVRRYGKYEVGNTGGFTSGNGQFVSKRVLKWGPVRQVLSDRHGSFQANQFTVQLSDYDRALRTILSTTSTKYIDGKEIELLIETKANAALSVAPLVISRGIITGYKFNRDLTVDLTVTDPLGYRYSSTSLDRPIPYRVIGPTFPGCAETSVGRAVPIIYGEMSDDYSWSIDPARIPVGIVPVIHVGKANLISAAGIPGSEWEAFVICGHALTCVQSVFASNLAEDGEGSVRMPTSTYGSEFLVPGINVPLYYDIVGTDGVTQRFSLFFASGDRATAHITGKVPITLNVFGIEDVGDGSGDTITEIAYQYQHFLQSWVLNNYMSGSWPAVPTFTDGTAKVRTNTFDTVNATHAARLGTTLGYNGAMYIGDQKPAREHNREFMIGGDIRTGVNHQGQVLAITVRDTSPTTGLTTYTATDHVVQDSFEITPQVDEIFNVYTYEYGPEPATNRVSGIAQTIRDTASVTNHSERIAQALLYRTTRQKPTADDVAGRTLLRSANAPTDVMFSLDLRGVALALGQLIRITHYQGIGVSGWTSRVLMVTGITTNPDEDDFSTTIEAEDVQGLLDAGALALAIDSGQIDVSTVA